jgi:hypothetical protein
MLRYENLKIEKRRHVNLMNETFQRYENTILKLEVCMENYVSNLEEKCEKMYELLKKYSDSISEDFFLTKEHEPLIKECCDTCDTYYIYRRKFKNFSEKNKEKMTRSEISYFV